MGHDHLTHARGPKSVHAGLDGSVETPARLPDDQSPVPAGPIRHLGVVAHDGDGERAGGPQDLFGHGSGQASSLGRTKGGVEPTLCLVERLHRNQDRRLRVETEGLAQVERSDARTGHPVSVRRPTGLSICRAFTSDRPSHLTGLRE